jgi:pimeloyl-ACP methyl ester carboxylesterase
MTWSKQMALASTFRLIVPWRRGYAPSAASARQDWRADARDLLRIAPARSHLVAHSYGAVGALIAAARSPARFRSLTLIEPPLWSVAPGDAEVNRLVALSRAFAAEPVEGEHADFLALSGLPADHPETARVRRRARGLRDPGEARVNPRRLSRLPCLVVSGNHDAGLERVCDRLAALLNAERWSLSGAGHAVQKHADFNSRLEGFLAGAL